jgi:hypothetical protein
MNLSSLQLNFTYSTQIKLKNYLTHWSPQHYLMSLKKQCIICILAKFTGKCIGCYFEKLKERFNEDFSAFMSDFELMYMKKYDNNRSFTSMIQKYSGHKIIPLLIYNIFHMLSFTQR